MTRQWTDRDDHKLAWVFVFILTLTLIFDSLLENGWGGVVFYSSMMLIAGRRFYCLHWKE